MSAVLPALLAQQQFEADTTIPWWAYIFYLWLIVSVCVYGYRIFRRLTRGKTEGSQVVRAATPVNPVEPLPESSGGSRDSAPAAPFPSPPTARRDSGGGGPHEDRSAGVAPVAPSNKAGTTSGRTGLFAASEAKRSAEAPRLAVARLLEGISLPCDLAPVISADKPVRASVGLHVAFSTSGVDPREIGQKLGDELERLGFSVESVSASQVQATRQDGGLLVSLLTDPAKMTREGKQVYPTMPPGSTVVEVESI